jgi:hypothetical protein
MLQARLTPATSDKVTTNEVDEAVPHFPASQLIYLYLAALALWVNTTTARERKGGREVCQLTISASSDGPKRSGPEPRLFCQNLTP